MYAGGRRKLSTQTGKEEGDRPMLSKPPKRTTAKLADGEPEAQAEAQAV